MTSPTDLLSTCSTNAIVLHDFGEVAYIVATVPPANTLSRENKLAKLRSAQKQFHDANILATIELNELQLFTFYKKVDVVKDQRTILTKFGTVMRENGCTITYRAAILSSNLFNPENAKLCRMLVAAILSSVKINPIDDRRLLPMGQRYHVLEQLRDHIGFSNEQCQPWTLLRTDLQIALSGQVVISVSAQRVLMPFVGTDGRVQQTADGQPITAKTTPVSLAPSGQLAVYRNGWIGTVDQATEKHSKLVAQQRAILGHWHKLFETWAETELIVNVFQEDQWIELVIPVQEQVVPESTESPKATRPEPKQSVSLKSFFWPAKLCFALNVVYGQTPPIGEPDASHDPVQFITDWFESLAGGDFGLQKEDGDHASDSDDGPVFAEDGPFDNPEAFQPFGPPAFPTAQTVYPTPPDAVMTHATPAMSTGDGLAATPLTATRPTLEPQNSSHDRSQLDSDINATDNVGSGLYDDDLFDDMPDDTFGQETGEEEPNWEFFDEPGSGEAQTKPEDAQAPDVMDTDPPDVPQPGQEVVNGNITESPRQNPNANMSEPERTLHSTNSPNSNAKESATAISNDDALNITVASKAMSPPSTKTARRRSSVFDAVDQPVPAQNRDQRYAATGTFYFDSIPRTAAQQDPKKLDQWLQRSPSVSSASGSDTEDDDESYFQDSPEERGSSPQNASEDVTMLDANPAEHETVDMDAIEADGRVVFDLVSFWHARASLEDAVLIGRPHGLPQNFDKPQIRNDFGSELVRQLTQTSLLQEHHTTRSLQLDDSCRNEVVLSAYYKSETCMYSHLPQVLSAGATATGKPSLGKICKLVEPDISMKRLDKPINARISILPFWDILGLQPASQAKDLAAFCIHPNIPGMRDNCAHFLDRIADAYTTCSLGQHTRGSIEGITTDGLIASETNDNGMFLGPVRKIAQALSSESQPGGAMIIYIVAQANVDTAYVYASIASYAIRRHVQQHWAKRSDSLDLAVQIIPAAFVSSPDEIVVPCQGDFNILAHGVFSQIPPDQTQLAPGKSDYPLTLANGRENVRFGLDANAIWPLSQDSTLHLAYSYSEDRRWLMAAWTDSKGSLAMWMPYELKTMVIGPTRSTSEVIKDIWTVSTELMAKQRARWRLVVSKLGTYEAPEVNGWMTALNAQANTSKTKADLVLLSIDMTPTLRLFPQPEHAKPNQQAYGTPASTPQGVTSPEQIVAATPTPGGPTSAINAPTPPEHSFDPNVDGDLSLTDPVEAAWAIILPFGVNQAKDILEMRPAVASGYLVKRTGRKTDNEADGLTLLGVHMIWPLAEPPTTTAPGSKEKEFGGQRERELEEYIGDFRGLVTLAAARGVVDRETSCVPWHVHTALSGATALGRLI